MKTAMELALARIEMLYGMKPDAIHWEMFKNDCMEKEKEQIIYDYMNGKYYHQYEDITAEEYYNQTYNQNK
jgi:hypothetical protein